MPEDKTHTDGNGPLQTTTTSCCIVTWREQHQRHHGNIINTALLTLHCYSFASTFRCQTCSAGYDNINGVCSKSAAAPAACSLTTIAATLRTPSYLSYTTPTAPLVDGQTMQVGCATGYDGVAVDVKCSSGALSPDRPNCTPKSECGSRSFSRQTLTSRPFLFQACCLEAGQPLVGSKERSFICLHVGVKAMCLACMNCGCAHRLSWVGVG